MCYKNFFGHIFWAPMPYKRYQNTSGCSTGYGPACPKFSEVTNCQYRWIGLSDFVDFLLVVVCILLDIY